VNENDQYVALDPWRGVFNAIRPSILAGDYAPGERLVEQQLADRFGTSRGPIRTALHELERNGLVESVDRKGTFVRKLTNDDIEEVVSLFQAVFGLAVSRAIPRMGPKDRDWFVDWLKRFPEDTSDGELLMNVGIEFAREVFRLAAHKRATEIFESLLIQAQARTYFVSSDQQEGWAEYASRTRSVVQAIIDGDVEVAAHGGDHWVQTYTNWLDSQPAPGSDQTPDH
jgi:DNA-binding GntR family transcriptional regulator